jgi:hypothetical protein
VKESKTNADADRKKVFVVSKQRSHAEEIEERLSFLKYFATQSDFEFKKVQLRVIYDSLSQSPIRQDQAEFLTWCKQCCQEQRVLDLSEMGEYFSELMQSNKLDVETLSVVGFEFLANYVVSVNENQSNLLRLPPKEKKQKNTHAGVTWNSYYVDNTNNAADSDDDDEEDSTNFSILIDPRKLEKLDMIWVIIKKAQNPLVVKRSIDFMIKIYTNLCDDLKDRAAEIAQLLISLCVKELQRKDVSKLEVERFIQILRQMIEISERKGTGDIQPHSAILRGEQMNRIIIKNDTRPYYPKLIVRVFSSATVWEFVDKVTRMCDLAPQFADVTLPGARRIKETDYGKTLSDIGLKNHDIITVKKNKNETPDMP